MIRFESFGSKPFLGLDPLDELCMDKVLYTRTKDRFRNIIHSTLSLACSDGSGSYGPIESSLADSAMDNGIFSSGVFSGKEVPEGGLLEKGWEAQENSSALRWNV